MPGFYKPEPNETHAYYTDGTHEWYGWASAGTLTSQSHWQIVKLEYDSDNWIEKYPAHPTTGEGTDQPMFEWDEVASYTYRILGAK